MGFGRLFLVILRRNALLSPSPLHSQWPYRSKNILPAFLSNRLPIFGSYRGVAYHRALLSNEAPIDPRLEFVAEQIEQFETEDTEQQNVDTHKTEQRQAVEEVIGGVSLEKNKSEFQHPWPEWTAFMGYLVSNDYFKGFVDDDEKDFFNDSDILKDYNHVRNACLNFGRDRFDILRSLSKEDIQAIVEHGCPSIDRKVVNSGKRLRSYVNIEEGEVCSKCNLRGSCDRAYIKAPQEECARTVDLLRILLTYGIDPVMSSTETKLQMKKTVKASILKLLKDVVELAATPLDPIPKQIGPTIKQAPPPPTKRIGFADIKMKEGDWRCPGCNLVNFARNTICIKCNEKRPKSTLSSGDWECPDCSFLNFRRNMKCIKCDCDLPKDDHTEIAKQLNPEDWKCPKCNFVNFRRNMTCLECDYKHPKNDQTEIAKQLNPADWKCPKCNFLNFKRNMTCLKCDCKNPGDYNTEIARQLNPGDWKCPECNFMNFGRNMRCLKCDFRHLKDEDKEYNFHAKANNDMLNSPRRRKSAGLGGDDYNFDDFPVRGGNSKIARGRMSGGHGNKNISQFGSDIKSSSSVGGNSNDFSDLDLLDEDEDDSDDDSDVDYKQKRVDSGRPSSTSARMGGRAGNNLVSDDFPVRGGSGTAGLRKLEKNGNKTSSQQNYRGDKSSSFGDDPNDFSDLDSHDDDKDVGYKWKRADGGRSSGRVSDRYGRLSTSFKGKGKGYNYDDNDDEDGLFDSDQGKRLGPSERSLFSKSKSVKKSFENFGAFDKDDDDDLCESEDEQPQVSRTKQKGDKRSLSSKSKSVKRSFENVGDFDEDDDDDLCESEDEQAQVSRTKQKGDKRSFGG